MGFWSAYWSSLKPLSVEEPVDVWIHRPMGYLIAKAAFPTPFTPNQITAFSMVFATAAGTAFVARFPYHGLVGFACMFFSAAFDCADGMLARMRKSSSALGRMLDGLADVASMVVAIVSSYVLLYRLYGDELWKLVVMTALVIATVWTSSLHTSAYDHYKNVYLRLVHGIREGEDIEDAEARYQASRILPSTTLWQRLGFAIYLPYLRNQASFIHAIDPYTRTHLGDLERTERIAAVYAKHCERPMRILRDFFGLGALMLGIGVFNGLGRPDYYLLYRLVALNALFFLVWRPMQKRASKAAFDEIAALEKEAA